MDFNVISRLESHSKDLFRLGRRLQPIREGAEPAPDEDEDAAAPEADARPRAGKADEADLPQEARGDDGARSGPAADPREVPPSSADSFFDDDEDRSSSTSGEDPAAAGSALAREEAARTARAAKRRRRVKKAHYEDLWAAITRNMGKGFLLGWLGKVGINSLFPILDLVRGRRLRITKRALLFDAREYGLFIGSMLAIYNGIMFESKKYAAEFALVRHYRGFIAGAAAGSSLMWIPHAKRWPIVLFMLVRSLELQAKILVANGVVPAVKNGDVMLMSLASASMLHSWLFANPTLDRSYSGFLTKQSQVPPIVRESLGRMYQGLPLDLDRLNAARAKLATAKPLTDPLNYDDLAPGEILHPGLSLPRYAVKFFLRALSLAVPVYLPVFSVPILIFYPNTLIKRPVQTITRVLQGVMRSSFFLTMYVTMGFNSVTIMRSLGLNYKNTGSFGQVFIIFAGIISGLATAIEKKGRRIELALYVLSKAIEGRWNQATSSGLIRPRRNGDVLVFMYCFGVIAHAYTQYPDMLRSAYRALMSRFFDSERRHVFYAMPRIVSEQILGLGNGRVPSHPILKKIARARDSARREQEAHDDDNDDDAEEEEEEEEEEDNPRQSRIAQTQHV